MDITRFFKPKNPPPSPTPLPAWNQVPIPSPSLPPKTAQPPKAGASSRKLQPGLSFEDLSKAKAPPQVYRKPNGEIDLVASLSYLVTEKNKKRYSEAELEKLTKKKKSHGAFERSEERKKKDEQKDLKAATERKDQEEREKRFRQVLDRDEFHRRQEQLRILNNKLRAGESLIIRAEQLGEDEAELELVEGQLTNTELRLHDRLNENFHAVIGQGRPDAELMIIGDYATIEESNNAKAFSGNRSNIFKTYLYATGIDVDAYCYVTNVMKITYPGHRYSFADIDDHLQYLREEIRIVRPKQILCIGKLSATLAQHGFQLKEELRNRYSVRRDRQGTVEDGVYLENLYKLQRHGADQKAVLFREFKHVARVFIMEDISDFIEKQNNENFRKAWISKLGYLKDHMTIPRPPYVDLEEELENYHAEKGKGSLDDVARFSGVKFTEPTAVLFDPAKNSPPVGADYHLQLCESQKPLRVYLIERTFSKDDNCFVLFGRLKSGNTVSVIAKNPKFVFWINHESFMRQTDANGKSFYKRPSLKDIEGSLRKVLIPHFKSLGYRYAEYTDEQLWSHIGIDLQYTEQRSSILYEPEPSYFLQVRYNVHSHLQKIREYLQGILEGGSVHESDVSPIKQLNLYQNVASYSWFEIEPDRLRPCRDRKTSSELEYEVDVSDINGKGAVKTKTYTPKPEDEDHTRRRTLQFDGEMIKIRAVNDSIPVPEVDPIGRLSVLVSDKDDPFRPTVLDTVRNPKLGQERNVITTGRVNYVDVASFVVGVHEPLKPKQFDPKYLPWVPLLPNRPPTKHFSLKKLICLQQIYAWNVFIEQLIAWIGYVGHYRAKKILPPEVYSLIDEYIADKSSNVLEINNGTRGNPAVYMKWRSNMTRIFCCWSSRLPDQAVESPDVQPPRGLDTLRMLGSIQYNWSLFHPKPQQFFFRDERSMLAAFVEYCRQAEIDGFSGHNVCNFDARYIIRRLKTLDLRWDEFWPERGNNILSLGRGNFQSRGFLNELSYDLLSRKIMDTMANGKREFTIVNIPGRFVFDTLQWAQKDAPQGLPGFTLNQVATHILKDKKADLPYSSIPVQFFTKPDNLTKYCDKDTELCERIVNICDVQSFVVSSCRIIGDITLGEFYNTGVQRKNVSIYLTRLRRSGLKKLLPDINPFSKDDYGEKLGVDDFIGLENNPIGDDEDEEELDEEEEDLLQQQKLPEFARVKTGKRALQEILAQEPPAKRLKRRIALYQGARVINVLKGFYELPIPTLDFAALYPSIMRSENLGLNTIGKLEHFLSLGIPLTALWTSGELYPDPWNPNSPPIPWYFLRRRRLTEAEAAALHAIYDQPAGLAQCVKNADGTYTPALEVSDFAAMLEELSDLRAYYKGLMKKVGEKNPLYKAYNAAQNAVKILMNSLYGATGVRTGKLACLPIGASVTAEGRRTLDEVEQWMQDYFGATIVGGDTDSVFLMFPNVKTLNDIYTPTEMLIDPDKPESEVNHKITLPFIDHVVNFINRRQRPEKSIVFEKALFPFNVFACKRSEYGNNLPMVDPVTGAPCFAIREVIPIESKGTEGKRRSTAPYARNIFEQFDKLVMGEISKPKELRIRNAIEYVKGELKKILDGKFDYSQMIITSYYGKSDDQYSNKNHPTLVINRKRMQRGEEPYQLGERVPRVIVTHPDPKAKLFQKVEDPLYAMKNEIPLDLDYYIEKQLRIPLQRKIENIDPTMAMEKEMFADVDLARSRLKPGQGLYAYLSNKCELCKRQCLEQVCNICVENLDRSKVKEIFRKKTQPLKETITAQNKVCYECLGNVEETGPIMCGNIYCGDLAKRVIPTTRLENLKKLKHTVYNKLENQSSYY